VSRVAFFQKSGTRILEPKLHPHRRLIAAAFSGLEKNTAASVVVGIDSATHARAVGVARATGYGLFLADVVPVPALPAPFDPQTVLLLLRPVLPDVLEQTPSGDVASLFAAGDRGDDRQERDVCAVPPECPLGQAVAERFSALGVPAGELDVAAAVAGAVLWPCPYGRGEGLAGAMATALLDTLARRDAALDGGPFFAFGVRRWNREAVAAAFRRSGGAVTFCQDARSAIGQARAANGRVLGWAGRVTPRDEALADAAGVSLWRIEDGFLRSVGLGAGLARGASYAFDPEGIYFDATRESRLERLIAGTRLTEAERCRARRLREMLCLSGLTKYNTATDRTHTTVRPTDRPVLLVPGQVADDAGVRLSRSDVIDCANCANINLELLRQVRARNPRAHILYKPHPDVEAGLRAGRIAPEALAGLTDAVVTGVSLPSLLPAVDRVETFSSLAGFEALLRGVPVSVYGMPFYAGWGLTQDLTEAPRRRKGIELEALVHAAYVAYPFCVDPLTLLPCPPEFLAERLVHLRASRRHRLVQELRQKISWLGRRLGL
jgi:capsular polysaccharide export protein